MTGATRRQALAALAAAAAPGPALAQGSGWAAADALGERLAASRLAPGFQICVRKRGRTLYSRAFGVASLELNAPMTPASVCRIASVSKQFTSASILRLAQEGRLKLSDPLSRFLPDYPRGGEMTIEMMLNHTAGLGNFLLQESPRRRQETFGVEYDQDMLVELMRNSVRPQVFDPGTNFAYSNNGYVLLGVVAEKVSGLPRADLLQQQFFGPLGMSSTAVDTSAAVVPGRAQGYSPQPKAPLGFRHAAYISLSLPAGAGDMRSTASDLCLWHEALLGGRVLNAAMLQAMITPGRLKDGTLPKSREGRDVFYGLGQFLSDQDGRRCVWHNGGIPGFSSDLRTFPEEGLTIARLYNADLDGFNVAATRMNREFGQAVLAAARAEP